MTVAYDFSMTPVLLMVLFFVLFLMWFIFVIRSAVYYSKHPELRRGRENIIVLSFLVPLACLVIMVAGCESIYTEAFKTSVVASFENSPVAAKILLLENEIKTRGGDVSHATKKRFMSRQDAATGAAHVAAMTDEEIVRRLRDARETYLTMLDLSKSATSRN